MSEARFDPGRLAAIYAGGVIGALARVGLAQAAPHGAAPGPGRPSRSTWPAPCCSATSSRPCAGIAPRARVRTADHGHLRHADHLRDPAAGALRDGRRRRRRPRRRLRRRRRLAGGYLLIRLGLRIGGRGDFLRMAEEKRLGGPVSAAAWIAVGAARRRRWPRPLRDRRRALRPSGPPFPLGILVVNLAGTLVLGVVAGAALSGEALAIVAGGGIGSFTTFSTWMLDPTGSPTPATPGSPGSTSASRCSPASPPSPSATGSAGRSEQGKVPHSPSAPVFTLNRETKERRRWKSRRRRRR